VSSAEEVLRALAATDGGLAAARRVARRFEGLDDGDVDALLWTGDHPVRLVAVLLLVHRFRAGDDRVRADVLDRYLGAVHAERLDSAELVDVSAEHIVGEWYADRNDNPLYAFAKSDVVWERRMVLMATLASVKRGSSATALGIAERLVRERGAVVQEALGLVLREVGKRVSEADLVAFLDAHGDRLGGEARAIATGRLQS
jgi:3-methyladenine DNA glycosylase AlkD